jgi:hypothetical protein
MIYSIGYLDLYFEDLGFGISFGTAIAFQEPDFDFDGFPSKCHTEINNYGR